MEDNLVLRYKLEEMMLFMNAWIENLHSGKSITTFFEKRGYASIALYGTSYISLRIQEELEGTGIDIVHVFDKNNIDSIIGFKDKVDVIVVTSLFYFYEVIIELEKIVSLPIICADELVNTI